MTKSKFAVMAGFLQVLGILIFTSLYFGLMFFAFTLIEDKIGMSLLVVLFTPHSYQGLSLCIMVGGLAIYTAVMFLILFNALKNWDKYMQKQLDSINKKGVHGNGS